MPDQCVAGIDIGGTKIALAVADLTKALSLDARLPLAHVNRGLALMVQGKDAEAERDFGRALELVPSLRANVEAGVAAVMRLRKR